MLKQRLESINERIRHAAESCNRDAESVRLVAVSKTIPAEKVKDAIESGVTILGENYVQEARDKFNALIQHPVSWHFIANKAKYAVRLFDLIHSVDSLKLARELHKQAQKADKIQPILVQVNISGEGTKSGIAAQEAPGLILEISRVRPFFAALRELRDEIKKHAPANVSMQELSMGMTGDFEVAIEEGATLVRVGTAIFGERK
jgi:pyridoxal phosphate enzyme (YggS family)